MTDIRAAAKLHVAKEPWITSYGKLFESLLALHGKMRVLTFRRKLLE